MSIVSIEQQLAELKPGYYPNHAVAEALSHVTMAPLIGPVAVGKSSCLARIVGTESDFGRVQGSDLSDYTKKYTLFDTLAAAVTELRALPFEKMVEITVVTEPDEWVDRFKTRAHHKDDARKRLKEGVISLSWSFEQGGENMHWVVNGHGMLREACNEIIGLVKDTREGNPQNRYVG